MRILWLSNKVQTGYDQGTTGTWLDAMASLLMKCPGIELGNIARGPVTVITKREVGPIQQWVVPARAKPKKNGLPGRQFVNEIIQVINDFSPDLVHIWGTEGYWGLFSARRLIQLPTILEIQGILSAIANVVSGGLTLYEQIGCIGLKECLRFSTVLTLKRKFRSWIDYEKEMIMNNRYISVQSIWQRAYVKAIQANNVVFHRDPILRKPFYTNEAWQYSGSKIIFFSAAYPAPFKGLHIAVRAVRILKRIFPNIQLRIAGPFQRPRLQQDGYISWIKREIRRLRVEENISWLGVLNADQIVQEMRKSAVVLIPTFIESYCMAVSEAMIIGVPIVVSYVGGIPSLASDEYSALFFPPGDEVIAAYQIERVIKDRDLAEKLSKNARSVAIKRHSPDAILKRQMEIYKKVLSESK